MVNSADAVVTVVRWHVGGERRTLLVASNIMVRWHTSWLARRCGIIQHAGDVVDDVVGGSQQLGV